MEPSNLTNNYSQFSISPTTNVSISNSRKVLYLNTPPFYFSAIFEQNFTFSIDNIRVRYSFESREPLITVRDFLENKNPNGHSAFYTYKKNFSNTTFFNKDVFNIRLQNGATFYIELTTHRKKQVHQHECIIEFNPNKCFGVFAEFLGVNFATGEINTFIHADLMYYLITFIHRCSTHVKIIRFDLAVDIPINRCLVHVLEENRHYKLVRLKSSVPDDYTEYLGVRNTSGFTKIYSKSAESGLAYDLTRIEITSKYYDSYEKFIKQWPEAYAYTEGFNIPDFFEKLNETENVICIALSESHRRDALFQALGRGMKRKIKPYLYGSNGCIFISVPEDIYNQLMAQMLQIVGVKNEEDKCFALNTTEN